MDRIFKNQSHIGSLAKSSFYNLLKIVMFESLSILYGKFYEQGYAVVMGSPLGPALANLPFWKYLVGKLSTAFQANCLWMIRRWHIFTFSIKESYWEIQKYFSKQHKSIKCASAIEENSSLSFLDIKISSGNNNLWHQFTISLHLVAFSQIWKFHIRHIQACAN